MKEDLVILACIIFLTGFGIGVFAGKKDGKREAAKEINIELIERGLKYHHPESGEIIWK
jgi:hypothetical protein